ncbi:MAG: hypothetical protein R2710_04255 [Acidimicrobiales bacterium]
MRTARSLWSDADRDPSLLLSGQPLDDAMAVTADPIAQLHLEPADEEFLAIKVSDEMPNGLMVDAVTSRHIATAAAAGRVRASNERPAWSSGLHHLPPPHRRGPISADQCRCVST